MINSRLISRLRKIDWDFADSRSESPFSSIHWQPGRFASQIPAAIIGLLTEQGELVLDPFAGGGTTLIESQRLARRSIGIDINPVACLAARSKVLTVSLPKIRKSIERLKVDAQSLLAPQRLLGSRRGPTSGNIPPSVQGNKWYAPAVLRDLALLWSHIRDYEKEDLTLAEAAFSASLLPICRETRHWGYVCDNTQPIGDHQGNVFAEYSKVLDRLKGAYEDRSEYLSGLLGEHAKIAPATIHCNDALQSLAAMAPETVDLVMTSPPYFGVCDYVKAQRLSMEWHGFQIEEFRKNEIGARSKRHRKEALSEYITELVGVFSAVRKVLKPDGCLAIVIGQSLKREAFLDALRGRICELGFTLELDIDRRVRSQRRQTPSLHGEHILIYSK